MFQNSQICDELFFFKPQSREFETKRAKLLDCLLPRQFQPRKFQSLQAPQFHPRRQTSEKVKTFFFFFQKQQEIGFFFFNPPLFWPESGDHKKTILSVPQNT